ncbi:MAG: molybdopterin-dependent oxidoreductase [Pyrinomonadaceae bacterium]
MSDQKEDVLIEQVRELRRPLKSQNTAEILGEKRHLSAAVDDETALVREESFTRRGFIAGGAAALFGIVGWGWMSEVTRTTLLRRTFQFNERVAQIFYRPRRLAPEFAADQISAPRVNGFFGMETELDAAAWRLAVGGLAGRADDLLLTLDDLKRLPRTEMTTELKCIEGWSVIVNWAGVRFSDFSAAFQPTNRPEDLPPYISMTTPDETYFVGWDTPSIMHPQTLLAYEMNGEPLRPEHGAPLRLASPTKYGIKQIKRIGRIEYTATRPRDYWAEAGYDWYAGL